MKSEVFITVAGILAAAFLFIAKQNAAMSIVMFATVLYSAYCAYYYKGARNIGYSAIPVAIFIAFVYTSGIGESFANLMMFATLIVMIYFAMNVETPKTVEKPVEKPIEKTSTFCSGCGIPVELDAAYCKGCGAKL